MKKILFSLCFFLLSVFAFSQNGLEGVIVEEYYTSTAADASASVGTLPVGSKTYRVFVDMLPGYKFQAVFGNGNNAIKISTSTKFFNNEDRGAATPNGITKNQTVTNTVMLDSWVTCGLASSGTFGVLRSEDTDANFATSGILSTINPDGHGNNYVPGQPNQVQLVGFTNLDAVLGAASQAGSEILSNGASWASLGGVEGLTSSNRVLVGQFTTDGTLTLELNIQVVNTATGDVTKFVHTTSASANEVVMPSLKIRVPNTPPTVSLTAPAAGFDVMENTVINIAATTSDVDGTVSKVEFFNGTTSIGVDATPGDGFTLAWPSVAGAASLTAVATDNGGAVSTPSAAVTGIVRGNIAPSITNLSATPAPAYLGDVLTLKATVTDDGAVAGVMIYVDGTIVGTPVKNGNEYSVNYTVAGSKGSRNWSVYAIDNGSPAKETTVNSTFTVGNKLPTVNITSAPAQMDLGAKINLVAEATDTDGNINSVEFWEGSTKLGNAALVSGNSYSLEYTASAPVGNKSITAKAIDSDNGSTTSSPVTIDVKLGQGAPEFTIANKTDFCSSPDVFTVPIITNKDLPASANVIGFDIDMIWDEEYVTPTGIVYVGEYANGGVVTDRDYTSYRMNVVNDSLLKLSIWINSNPSAPLQFVGETNDTVVYVEFSRKPAFGYTRRVNFKAPSIFVSHPTIVDNTSAIAGWYETIKETKFVGYLKFWSDNSAIADNANAFAKIFGTDPAGEVIADANGKFIYDISKGGATVTIDRDVTNATDVQSVIGSLDAYYTARVTVDDKTFKPTIFQILAMDVNRDSRVTAGDITQMQQRTVGHIQEYTQATNSKYSSVRAGHRDWIFVSNNTLLTDPSYRRSVNYPASDPTGFDKSKLPVVTDFIDLPVGDPNCPTIGTDEYKGILLGDVTGNYASTSPTVGLKSGKVDADKFVMSIKGISKNEYEVTISVSSSEKINAYDLSFDCAKIESFTATDMAGMNSAFNLVNNRVKLSAYTFNAFKENNLVSLKLQTSEELNDKDIKVVTSSLNEKNVGYEMSYMGPTGIEDLTEGAVSIYPNPVSDVLSVAVVEKSTIQVMDVNGKVVMEVAAEAGEVKELDVTGLADGMYVVKVVSEKSKAVSKKVLVQK